MSNKSILPDVVEPISNAIQQNIPETAKQADGILSTVVGFFNNVVLYPVKKANLTFRYKLEAFEDDLKKKIERIPPENLQVPPTMISGPTLESLRYTYDEEELREMYENLLASAMDNRIVSKVHPSFVDAIKQMSPLDAKIISKCSKVGRVRCASITFHIKDMPSKVYVEAMPDYFVDELKDIADPFVISASLSNLQRLGLITITDTGFVDTDYEDFKTSSYVLSRKKLFESFEKEIIIEVEKRALIANDYGKQFSRVCLSKGETENAD